MCNHRRPVVFSLIAGVALLAASCSYTEQPPCDQHHREVALLQQQLEEQDHRLDDLRSEVNHLSRSVYKLAAGQMVTIDVGEGTRSVDVASVIKRMPFSFAVYDSDGYKREARTIKRAPKKR